MLGVTTVTVMGNLVRDPEIRKFGDNGSVCNFSIAVNTRVRAKDGGNQPDTRTDFINCVAFNRTADLMQQYCHKGDPLYVFGRLQSRSYVDKNHEDVKHNVTEVIVQNLQFLPNGRRPENANGNNAPAAKESAPAVDTLDGFAENLGPINPADEADIPF